MLKLSRDLKENHFAAEPGNRDLLESVAGNLLNKILPILITALIAFCFIELFWAEKGVLAVVPPLIALLLSLVAYFYLRRGQNLLDTANVIASKGVIDEGVLFTQKPFTIAELATKIRMALV